MYKNKLDDLLKRQVLTQDEYDKFFESMSENEDGKMIGVVPSDKCVRKYEFDGNLFEDSLSSFILKEVIPPLGAEDYDDVFKVYGYSYFGICDGYHWFTESEISEEQRECGYKPIEEASETELWKIIAICSRYWESQYKEWEEHKPIVSKRMLKTISVNPNDIVAYYYNHKMSYELIDKAFHVIKEAFPNNKTIGIPDDSSINTCSKVELEQVAERIQELLKTIN